MSAERPLRDPRFERRSGARRIFLWAFSATMVAVAGTAFVLKLTEFIHTATTEGSQALGSFLLPVLNYLLVAAGFACLFLWAYATGQFRDVEAPKYRMLELEREFEERAARGAGRGGA
jgi:nitrogen fixation-related uncharacterized protein